MNTSVDIIPDGGSYSWKGGQCKTVERPLSFTQWLARAQNSDSPLGDLARDVARDPDWPGDADISQVYLRYLSSRHASESAINVWRKAWKSYSAYLRNHPTS